MARKLFTEEQIKEIENEVLRAEERTSGEIVPLVVSASDEYGWTHWFGAVFGLLVATGINFWLHRSHAWGAPAGELLFWQVFGASLGGVLPFLAPLKRLLLPGSWIHEHVHRQCLANFVAMGLHATRDRTGVLIYVSLLEHRVEILADRGIHEKVGQGYWEEQVSGVARAIREDRAAEGLRAAIRSIGEHLARDFPKRSDDINEQSNELRFGDRSLGKPGAPSGKR